MATYTIQKFMDTIDETRSSLVIEAIREAYRKMALTTGFQRTVYTTDSIVTDTIEYDLPENSIQINSISLLDSDNIYRPIPYYAGDIGVRLSMETE